MLPFEKLVQDHHLQVTGIVAARNATDEAMAKARSITSTFSGDFSLVAFGSLARKEWTSGSDLDWTLLIDGQADPHHYQIARDYSEKLEGAGFERPGATGLFGQIAFSHDIIHHIGGSTDTNQNTT